MYIYIYTHYNHRQSQAILRLLWPVASLPEVSTHSLPAVGGSCDVKAPMFSCQGLRCLRLTASQRLKTDTCEQLSLTDATGFEKASSRK